MVGDLDGEDTGSGRVEPDEVFDDRDGNAIRRVLAGLGASASTVEGGPGFLVAEWERFVARCEAGFRGSRLEFLSKLSVRTLLERVMERVPDPLRRRIRRRIEPLDYRYRALGRLDEEFLLPPSMRRHHDPERFFWLHGFPGGCRTL